MDYANTAWLAGFIDGEGCFTSNIPHLGAARKPRFAIGMRWDDRPVLEELQKVFGGSVCTDASPSRRSGNRQDAVRWTLVARKDLIRLCKYLDRFPLQTRKREQYAEWRMRFADFLTGDDIQPKNTPVLRFVANLQARKPDAEEVALSEGVSPAVIAAIKTLYGTQLVQNS